MPPRDTKIRMYIAVRAPETVRAALQNAADYLESAVPNQIRWVNPETIHLTLKFLGDVPASRADRILAAMERAAGQFDCAGFRLGLGGLGTFGRNREVRVFWCGVQGETDKLEELHHLVDSALEGTGFFAPDRPPYRPHITLGRPRNHRGGLKLSGLADTLKDWQPPAPVYWKVDRMHLFHSILGYGPPRHIPLGSVVLERQGFG